MKTIAIWTSALHLAAGMVAAFGVAAALAQTPPQPEAKPEPKAETKAEPNTDAKPEPKTEAKPEPKASDGGPLAALAWLEGCWKGVVNRREFREHWMPLRGNLLIGVSHMVMQDKTQGFEYLRLESRPDGIYYVASPSGKAESAFRLTEQTIDRTEGRNDQIFTFANPAQEFPQKITYRRASEGWLYAAVEGKSGGKDREVTYPMRRVDCESGEFIRR
jgi:hypothetical protein